MNTKNQPRSSSSVWYKQISTKRKQVYYYNKVTGESYWEKPEGVEIIDGTALLTQRSQGEKVVKNSSEDEIDEDELSKLLSGDDLTSVNKGKPMDHNRNGKVELDLPTKPNLVNGCSSKMIISPIKRENYENNLILVAKKLNELKKSSPQKRKNFPKRELCIVPHKISKTPIQDRFNRQKEELLEKLKKEKKICDKNLSLETGASKRRLSPIQDTAKRPRIDYEELKPSPAYTAKPVEGPKVFDLRTKIEESKLHRLSFQSTPASSWFSEMPWEDQSPRPKLQDRDSYRELGGTKESLSPTSSSKPELLNIPSYKRVYVVCDTNALVNDNDFAEHLISKGSFLDLPVTVVIPFVVFNELDNLKKVDGRVGFNARKISRTILKCSPQRKQNKRLGASLTLQLQAGERSRTPVGTLDLETNDDLVLNCGLQVKQDCEKEELPLLITGDNNLTHKATSYQLSAHTWTSFKKWARRYKEQTRILQKNETEKSFFYQPDSEMPYNREVSEDEKMDVDSSTATPEQVNKRSPSAIQNSSVSLKEKPSSENFNASTDSNASFALCNCASSHFDEVKLEFQAYLQNVLDEALDNEYGDLKAKANKVKPSWTFYDYILEIRQRWFLITSTYPSSRVQQIINSFTMTQKKCNSGKEAMTVADVENMFSHCRELATMLEKKYHNQTKRFLETLNMLEFQWKDDYSRVSTTNSTQNITENDIWCQPVEVALQNIFVFLKSGYEKCKEDVENIAGVGNPEISERLEQEILEPLALCCQTTTDIKQTLQSVFQENPHLLTCNNENVKLLHKKVTHFCYGKETILEFESTLEHVVELFVDTSYRNGVTLILEKFKKLQSELDSLICVLEDMQLDRII